MPFSLFIDSENMYVQYRIRQKLTNLKILEKTILKTWDEVDFVIVHYLVSSNCGCYSRRWSRKFTGMNSSPLYANGIVYVYSKYVSGNIKMNRRENSIFIEAMVLRTYQNTTKILMSFLMYEYDQNWGTACKLFTPFNNINASWYRLVIYTISQTSA